MTRDKKTNLFKATLMGAASVLGLGVADLAHATQAADSGSTAVSSDERAVVGDEIVVQGRFQQSLIDRIPVSPQELPFSLDIINRDLLNERNYTRAIDALSTLPSIEISTDDGGFGQPEFIVRGFSAPILVNNRVQTNIRGGGIRDDAFIDRYEVLRGPASIALGPVDGGAVINTVTKSPQAESFLGAEINADNFGTTELELDYNIGAIDSGDVVRARISGAYRDIEFDAEETRREVFAIRPVIEIQPTENTNAQISAAYVKMNLRVNWGFPLYNDGSIPEVFDTDTYFGYENANGDYNDLFTEVQVNHEFLDNLKLTLRGSYQRSETDYQNEGGLYNYYYDEGLPGISRANPYAYIYGATSNNIAENYFGDAQLSWNFDLFGQQQDVVVGGSILDTFARGAGPFGVVTSLPIVDIDLPQIAPAPGSEVFGFDEENKLRSGYMEFALRPTDWATLIGGVRYDNLTQSEQEFENVNVRIGASVALREGLNTYFSFAEAFSPQFGQLTSGGQAGPLTSDSIELGLKGRFLNGKMRVNAAIYRTLRRDVAVRDRRSDIFANTTLVEIGEVRNQGFEISGDIEPIDGFNLNLNYGYLDAEVLTGEEDIGLLSFAEHTASFFATYTVQSGRLRDFKVGGGGRYVGEQPSNLDGFSFPETFVVDALASYPINDKLDVQLNILNVFDDRYLESAGRFFGRLNGISTFGAPRTFRITFRGAL